MNGAPRQGGIFVRQAEILSRYGRLYDYISKTAEFSNWTMPLLKDVVPDKKEQSLIFRELNSLGFRGSAVDFLCWLSLARVSLELAKHVSNGSISVVDWIMNLILLADKQHDIVHPNDMCNILKLYAHSQYFYFYWEYEIDNRPYPFNVVPNQDNSEYQERSSLTEMTQADSMLSAYFELMWWERTCDDGSLHKDRDKIFAFIDKIYHHNW